MKRLFQAFLSLPSKYPVTSGLTLLYLFLNLPIWILSSCAASKPYSMDASAFIALIAIVVAPVALIILFIIFCFEFLVSFDKPVTADSITAGCIYWPLFLVGIFPFLIILSALTGAYTIIDDTQRFFAELPYAFVSPGKNSRTN